MMEQVKAIFDKIPAVLLLAVFLGYLGYGHYEFVTDSSSPLLQKRAQVEAAQQQKTELQAKIKSAQDFFQTLEKRRVSLRGLAKELEGLKVTLSEQLDQGALIKAVAAEAEKVGLTVSGIKPTELKESEYYSEQAFALGFHGVYVQLVVFLERIANLDRIIRVDNFDIKASSPATAQFVTLDGTLQLKAYRYKASKADDLGKDSKATPTTNKSGTPPAGTSSTPGAAAPGAGGHS